MHVAFRPKLITVLREGYFTSTFRTDAIARLTAVIVTLTRSLAALVTAAAFVGGS